jgi:hypothetical protein
LQCSIALVLEVGFRRFVNNDKVFKAGLSEMRLLAVNQVKTVIAAFWEFAVMVLQVLNPKALKISDLDAGCDRY